MLFPALAALGGAFFFFVLRVQGADGCFPRPLSAEEEAKLLRKMREEGDKSARNLLIEHNLRLVSHIIKKYYSPEADRDDLVSIGTIGLIKAVDTFHAERGIRLATYASKCIQNELLMHFRRKRKTAGEVSLSDTLETDGDGNALSLQDTISCEDEGLNAVDDHDRYFSMYRALPPHSVRASAKLSGCGTVSARPLPCRSTRSPGAWACRAATSPVSKNAPSKSSAAPSARCRHKNLSHLGEKCLTPACGCVIITKPQRAASIQPNCVKVARQTLTLFVRVRILLRLPL